MRHGCSEIMANTLKPKQFEMQSGPGKHCDEKYNSLRIQDSQQASRKFIPTLQLPDFLSKIQKRLPPQVVDQLIEETQNHDKQEANVVKKTLTSTSWVFNSQSRSEYYQSTQRKDRVPSTGYYLPLYSSIYPNLSVPVIKPAPVRKRKQVNGSKPSEEGEIPDYPPRIKTAVAFNLQLKRPDISKMAHSVSDKRFELVPESLISSRMKRVVTPNLSKSLRRTTLIKTQSSPRYSPRFNAVWKKELPTIDFSKVTGRASMKTQPSTHLHYDNVRFSQINPRVTTSNFGSLSYGPENGALPRYMVSVNSRMALTVLQESSLVMSGFPFGNSIDQRKSTSMEGTLDLKSK